MRSWQAAYPGIVPAEYLASLSIDRHEAMWRASIEKGAPQLLVARDEDETMLGWVSFGASRDEGAGSHDAEIWAIYIDAPAWGRGVGRALCDHALPRLRTQGFTCVSLWAFPQNTRAIRFYEALGFTGDPATEKTFTIADAEMREIRFSMKI